MNYKLDITPQTHVRSTQGDKWYFRIPEVKLKPAGLARKRRLQQYNTYKHDLWALAQQQGIIKALEAGKCELIFYLPAPQYYRPVKGKEVNKRKSLEGTPHKRKPDWDNLSKAFFDALFPDDSVIYDVRVQKFWTTAEKGWIDVFIA